NEVYVSSFGAHKYDNVDVMMVMSVEELLDWIIDLGGSYHMTYERDYLFDFEEYDDGNVLLGDDRECRVWVTIKVQLKKKVYSEDAVSEECKKTFIASGVDTCSVQVLQGVEF
nr:retrovirus-related Pol polyprotein from transposon TNT 1-94 [Tanacetum cinerariifolium]